MVSQAVVRPSLGLLTTIAVGAGLFIGSLMPYGPGLRDDSYTYIHSAEMLVGRGTYSRLTGEGDLRPVTNFPPGYPFALALLDATGVGPFAAAKILNQILFGVFVLLIGISLWLATGLVWPSLLGILFAVLSTPLTSQFTWAQSEPLFLVLVQGGVLSLFLYLARRRNTLLLVVSGAALGMAVLTRYAGLGVVAGAVAVLVLDRRILVRRKLAESFLMLCLSLGPILLFLVRNLIVAGEAVNRPRLFWHPPPIETWASGAAAILRWALPDRWVAAVGPERGLLGAIVGMVVVCAILIRVLFAPLGQEDNARRPLAMAKVLSGSALGYLGLIVVTLLFVDRLTPLNDRILVPLHLFLLQMAAVGAALVAQDSTRNARLLTSVAAIAWVGLYGFREVALVHALREDGQGYSGRTWRESEVLHFVCGLPEVPIYSNDIPAVYFACGRHVRPLPSSTNLASQEDNPGYSAEVAALREAVLHQDGVIAIIGWYGDERLARLGIDQALGDLEPRAVFEDGIVYGR